MKICVRFAATCGACGCPYNDLVICKDSSDCLVKTSKRCIFILLCDNKFIEKENDTTSYNCPIYRIHILT